MLLQLEGAEGTELEEAEEAEITGSTRRNGGAETKRRSDV
jgi:hypothetical protein